MRTDTHCPRNLVPSEYIFRMAFAAAEPPYVPPINVVEANVIYLERGAGIHGNIFGCDICGAGYKYGCLFEHVPTGEVISVGHDCAHKLELAIDEGAFEMVRGKARELRLREVERKAKRDAVRAWGRANRALLPALRTDHPIVRDIRERLIDSGARWGLSEAQTKLVRELARRASEPKEVLVPAVIVEGRQTVEGELVSIKVYDGAFGSQVKATVKVAGEGGNWYAWGTLPAGCGDAKRGDRVRFQAKLTQGRERHFAVWARPTQGEAVA